MRPLSTLASVYSIFRLFAAAASLLLSPAGAYAVEQPKTPASNSILLPFEDCFEVAAARFKVEKRLLVAIAKTESEFKSEALGQMNDNGTYDIGMMQVNSTWLPALTKFGISRADLLNGCVSIHVGAWILSGNISRFGPIWRAVGAYNASSPSKQIIYVAKVKKNYDLVGQLVVSR